MLPAAYYAVFSPWAEDLTHLLLMNKSNFAASSATRTAYQICRHIRPLVFREVTGNRKPAQF